MSEPRFDVIYHGDKVSLDYHFCREWDGDEGCYGTNPNHGQSFDDAKSSIIAWYEQEIARWRAMTLAEWQGEIDQQ